MIGQVTNTMKGLNHYIAPEVEVVNLMTKGAFLLEGSGDGEDWGEIND